MPLDQAEALLTRLCGKAFHWRSPEDIVWIFGLRNNLDYTQTCALMERLKEKKLLDIPKKKHEKAEDIPDSHMTALVRADIMQLKTETELE